MINWVSCWIPQINIRLIRERLDFKCEHFVITGELKITINGFIVERAIWHSLKFEIHYENHSNQFARMKFSGSIHKFCNSVNFDNFYKFQLNKSIQEISSLIGVSPELIEVRAIEFGVNIHTEVPPNLILDRFIFFKQKRFEY